jgi:hypothetical protein
MQDTSYSVAMHTPLLTLVAVVAIVVGVLFIVLRKAIARYNIWGQNTTWGTHLGDRARSINAASQVVGGVVFIVVGAGLLVYSLVR